MTRRITNNTITIISNYYLKNIREELLEEEDKQLNRKNNEIIYVKAKLNETLSTVMIDTRSNISLIDHTELERVKQNSQVAIPTSVSYTHLDVYKRQP